MPSSRFQGGAFAGSPVDMGAMCGLRLLRPGERQGGRLRRRLQPAEAGRLSRAGRADGGLRGRKRDRRAGPEDRHGPDRVPPEERGQGGHEVLLRPDLRPDRPDPDAWRRRKNHPHYKAPLGKNQGRGIACGFWFNFGGQTCVSLNINIDGTVALARRHARYRRLARLDVPDGGRGARHPLRQGARRSSPTPARSATTTSPRAAASPSPPASPPSRRRATPSASSARRAAKIWGIPADAVVWENGHAKPAGANAGNFEPLSLADIAKTAGQDRRADRRPFRGQRRRRGRQLRHPHRRRRGRSRDRPHHGHALHRGAGRRQGDPSELCRGPVPGRCRPGHRLGAQRGIHLRQGRPAAERRASSTTAFPSPPTCR